VHFANGSKNEERVEKLAYSIDEISERTTLSKAYLRNKIREGGLRATKFGRRVLILKTDLDSFLSDGIE